MIRLLTALYKNKVSLLETHNAALELEHKAIEEAQDLVTDRPDKNGFVRMYSVNDREKGHIQSNQIEAVRKSREFDRWDPHAHGILNTLVNYIMGKGINITPKSDDPMAWWIWREFWISDRNKMPVKQFEIVRRIFRDGEIFIRFFSKDDGGAETGKTTIRFLDPLMVRAKGDVSDLSNLAMTINNGVNTDPEDIEKVISYTVQDRVDPGKFIEIPAEEVLHIKINADSDQKRGEPAMQTLLSYFRHYEQWIENRILLNKIRSAIVLIKKVEGTPTEVANMAATLPRATRTSAGDQKKQAFRGGTMITEGPGVTYRMEGSNINATDAKEDGRNIKLSMAAGMNMPEYIFGDASNANYSSTMVAESPFVKMIQFYQIFFEYQLGQVYKRVIQNAVNAGLLQEPNDDEFVAKLKAIRDIKEDTGEEGEGNDKQLSPREAALKELMPEGKMESPSEIFYGCDMDWPEVIHRDIKEQCEALTIARQGGWVSDSTASAALGYNYSEEVRKQRQIEEDAEIEDNPLLGTGGQGDAADMSAEMNDMLNGLTPEERTKVLNSTDPKEIAGIIGKRSTSSNGNGNGNGIGDGNGEGD
jgi:hypothetical protein